MNNTKGTQSLAFLRAMEYIQNYNEALGLKLNHQPAAFVHNFGCQQNAADAETLEGLLIEMGYTLNSGAEGSDIVLFNTCAVRENAENTLFGHLGNLKSLKTENPEMIIGICGCMTQQQHVEAVILKKYPFVDLLFGSGAMHTLPELIEGRLKSGERAFKVGLPTTAITEDLPIHRQDKVKAYIPIMTGCDNFCSYCVVPYVRGRERSREPEAIIAEARQLIKDGYKEITLLGQNVNSYGKGLSNPIGFSSLLRQLASLKGEFRIRFMTSHPKDCTKELIDTIAEESKIAKHIHLPVQSGSNDILLAMNRGYSSESYLELIAYAKKRIPDIAFTSDVIIGFPGETEQDFLATKALVDKVGYSSLYTFAYSPRQGTKAAELKNTLTRQEKIRRFQDLLALTRQKANQHNKKLVGTVRKVLAEGFHKQSDDTLIGRTDSGISVVFGGSVGDIGQFVMVEITDYMDWAVSGIKIN